jgi:hypothetical protein
LTQIKKFAWYGSSVALSALLAVTLLVSSFQTTQAATLLTATMTNGTNSPLAGSSVAASTQVAVVTVPAGSGIIGQANADYLYTLTFPTGTTFTAGATTAANWAVTTTGTGAFTATPVSVTTSGTALTFRLTQTTGLAAADTVIFSTAGGGAGIVRFPTANGTLAVNIATNAAPGTSIDSGSSSVTVVQVTVSASPSSVPGDGLSTSVITLVPAAAAATAGDTISLQTNNGQFIGATSAGATSLWGATTPAPTTVAPATSISGTTHAANAAAVNATATLRSPNTGVGSATVLVFITPAAGGSATLIGSSVVNFTANNTVVPTLPTAASVAPTTAVSTTLTGTTVTITATFTGAGNTAPIAGGAVTINSTMGTLASTTGQTCVGQSCTGTLPVGGAVGVTLTGTNAPGTAVITFTSNGVSVTKSVIIAGTVTALTAAVQVDADGAGAGTTFVNAATPGATSFTAGGGVRVSVNPTDAAGNRVPGVSPVIVIAPSSCATIGATTASTGAAAATTVLTAGSAPVGTECTVTATSGTGTATTTFKIGAVLAATSTVEIGATDMSTVATQTVTVTVKSATGDLVQDGTSVTLVVSAGAVATSTVTTINGEAKFTYVSPGTAQQVNLTAVAGTATASKAIGVGVAGPTPTPSGDGSLTAPTFGSGNIGNAVFAGGTIEQLAAQVTAAGGNLVWVQDANGTFRVYSTTAPAFVNGPFNTAFAAGFSGATAVTVVK